jgi:zinc protease
VPACIRFARCRRAKGFSIARAWPAVILALLLPWPSGARAEGLGAATARPPVLRATLDNGLRVVIVHNALAPLATVQVNYLAGSDVAPAGFPGMAHAQEHMMFRGSPGLSADQLANIAASIGGRFDADTQQTVTQYMFTAPVEDLDVVLRIEAIRMRGALDSEDLWVRERGAIEQEVAQDLSNPQYVAYSRLLGALFEGTPYAHDALGTRTSFDRTTGAMLKHFHDTWYAPNNALLVIVGDVDGEKVLAHVKTFFGGIPPRPLPARPEVRLRAVAPRRFDLDTDLPYGLVLVAVRLPGFDSPDVAAAQVLADVLDSQRGGLHTLAAQGKALDAGFSVHLLPGAGLGYAVAAFPRGARPSALLADVRTVLADAARMGVPADLVAAAKRRALARSEIEKTSLPGLAAAWSQALAVERRSSPEDAARAIEQVSVADVNRVARRYLGPSRAVVAVLTPRSSGSPVASKGFQRKESLTPPETKPVPLPEWAEAAVNRLSLPAFPAHPTVTTMANGLTLIVQPESISDTVSVLGRIRNTPGLQVPPRKEGLGEVLDRLFDFGTTSLDRVAFQRALDAIAADESAGTDFSLTVPAGEFERGVQLLADHELHPALPAAAFEIVRRQVAATVAGRLRSPDYLASRTLRTALLPADDPTLRQATPDSVSSLTLEDVRRYHDRAFRPDLTTIVVTGNVTPAEAVTVIERYFGGWRAEGPRPNTMLPPVPPSGPSSTVVPNASRIQDVVTLAETMGLTRSDPDYYALELGNHVLGGAFYATRLYRELRERAGLVYFVSSSMDVRKTRAFYVVEYACDPSRVSTARAIIERQLRTMQTTPASAEELRRAKALLLREIPLSGSSEEGIASGLLDRATRNLPLDEPIIAARRYLALTAEEVQAAFARYVRSEDLAQVTEGPGPR